MKSGCCQASSRRERIYTIERKKAEIRSFAWVPNFDWDECAVSCDFMSLCSTLLSIHASERARVVFIVYGLSNIRSTFCTRGPLKVWSLQFSSRKLDKKCTWNCCLDGFQQIESKWPVLFFLLGGTANSCFIKFLTLNWEILISSSQKLCLWINLCSLSCKFIVKCLLKYCYGIPE
jgi:hypothetical protein